jgi:hypothetical protein
MDLDEGDEEGFDGQDDIEDALGANRCKELGGANVCRQIVDCF